MAEFDRCADATLDEVKSIYMQRGGEYADSWALENQRAPFTRTVLRDILGLNDVADDELRLIIMAALVDVKDSRMGGPYKRDTVVDGIAYRAMFAQLMLEWETKCNNPSTSSRSPMDVAPTILSDHPMSSCASHTTLRPPETAPA